MKRIGLTGGIGSGKSFVAEVLSKMGYPVYYSDDRAKVLTAENLALRKGLISRFGVSIFDRKGLNKKALAALIQKNVEIKVKVVQKDEFEQGDRKLLNFGHTLGHAIENEHALLHGHAISVGMVYAAKISQVLLGFTGTGLLVETLKKYGLPTAMHFDIDAAMEVMQKDKKKANAGMQYVLLSKIGKGVYETIPMKTLQKLIKLYS